VWEELERWEATTALVRFSGGAGNQGTIGAVTLEDAEKRVLARLGTGEGELPEALAAPIWDRYALFRGHPRISGLLMWDVRERQVVVAGERGGRKFGELLSASRPLYRPLALGRGDPRKRRHRVLLPHLRSRRVAARDRTRDHRCWARMPGRAVVMTRRSLTRRDDAVTQQRSGRREQHAAWRASARLLPGAGDRAAGVG
jgi:hypothetical protein